MLHLCGFSPYFWYPQGMCLVWPLMCLLWDRWCMNPPPPHTHCIPVVWGGQRGKNRDNCNRITVKMILKPSSIILLINIKSLISSSLIMCLLLDFYKSHVVERHSAKGKKAVNVEKTSALSHMSTWRRKLSLENLLDFVRVFARAFYWAIEVL